MKEIREMLIYILSGVGRHEGRGDEINV